MNNTHNSSSLEQKDAEKELLAGFAQKHNLEVTHVDFPNNFSIQPDGVFQRGKTLVLVEAYAHWGTLKGSQPDKVCSDMLKLITAQKFLRDKGIDTELWILLACEEAKRHFEGKSWHHAVVESFGIHVAVGKLSDATIQRLKEAQIRQRGTQIIY